MRASHTPIIDALRLICAGAAILVLFPVGQAGAQQPDRPAALRERALELVNKSRQEHGRAPLKLGRNLNEAAQSHALDMLRREYYSHTSPEGDDVQDRYVAAGGSRWELVAENIARCRECEPPAGTERVERLHEGWMQSPQHRENILRGGLRRFGFGIVVDAQQGLYAVQTFAGPGMPRDTSEDAQTLSGLTEKEIAARAAELINRARDKANLAALEASPALSAAARNLLPAPDADSTSLTLEGNVYEALPAEQRERWQALSVVVGVCGGCGAQPTAADLRFFRRQWLQNPQYSDRLLDPGATTMGFAMQATGAGRKVALLILGTAR